MSGVITASHHSACPEGYQIVTDIETVHRRSHTHSKPSGKRAPMVANGMPDQNKTR
ncbi:hypothetical protein J6590_041077 [Homalodisca vitripennis]|nr:hypothetical protein J6590_041077 [Homalodisca vitripennis]